MKIRPFRKADYSDLTVIWNAVHPNDLYTAEEFQYFDESVEPPQKFGRLVAELDGRLAGAAEYLQFTGMYHPQKFFLRLYVAPEHERQGAGSALYDALMESLKSFDPITVRGQVGEDSPHAIKFVQERGFAEGKRDWESVLELADFDPEPYQGLINNLREDGIRFASITELGNTPELGRAFHALFSEVRQDVPRSEPATPISFESFKKTVLEAPDFFPEGTYLALNLDEPIGMTMFWKGEASDDLYTGLTAVKRSYRSRGVATALKVTALSYAKSIGSPRTHTDNDTKNVEMIAINDKLGFKKKPAKISMVKVLKEET